MNISDLLDDVKQNLSSDRYIKNVWHNLNDQSHEKPSKEEHRIFSFHLPFSFNNFLETCLQKLRHSIQERENQHLISIDYKYLIALIYYGLKSDEYVENVPIRAANIYFLIWTIEIDSVKRITDNSIVSKQLFHKCVKVLACHLDYALEIDVTLLTDLSNFLTTHTVNVDLERFIDILRKICETNNTEIFKDFYFCETINKSFLSFYCMRILVANTFYDENNKKEIVMLIVISLMKSLENRSLDNSGKLVLHANIRKFFQIILKDYITCNWFLKLYKELSKQYYDTPIFMQFVSELSTDFHVKLIKMITSEMASDHSCKLQDVAYHILVTSSLTLEYFERKNMCNLIIQNIILLFGHKVDDVKITALSNFEKILNTREPMIQEITQSFISANPQRKQINAITIYEILKKTDDVTWKKKGFNKLFINVACHLFIKCPQYLTSTRLQYLEMVCLKAPSVEFKQCIPVLMKLLRELVFLYPKIIILVLNILIHHSHCATSSTANYYIKELFEIIYETTNTDPSSDIALEITDTLISPAYDYQTVFKQFHSINLLNQTFLQKLFHKISLNQPRIWKIINNVLDYVCCTQFSAYTENYIRTVNEQLFLENYSGDMLNSINKITIYKLKRNVRDVNDVEFMNNFERYLSETIQVHNVPIKHIALVLVLLRNLKNYTMGTFVSIDAVFMELDEKLFQILQDIKLAENFEREMVYMGEMVLLYEYNVSDRNINGMQQLLTNSDILKDIPHVWSKIIVLYGKICMKMSQHIDNCIIVLECALKHGNCEVKHSAIAVLYDFCNIHLHHFELLYPYLEEFLLHGDNYLRYATGKLILKLNKDEQLRLKYNQLIVLILLFADENLKIRSYFREASKDSFLRNNEQLIAKHFLLIMMHLNNYLEHECFQFITTPKNLKLEEYNRDRRCLIYKPLLVELSNYNRIQLLNQFSIELLNRVLREKITLTENVMNILEDMVYVIHFMSNEKVNNEFYEQQIKIINRDLGKRIHQLEDTTTNFEQNKIIMKFMQILMQVIAKFSIINSDLGLKFFHSMLLITKLFYRNVIASLKENESSFRKTLTQLQEFYNKNKSHLQYSIISLNR